LTSLFFVAHNISGAATYTTNDNTTFTSISNIGTVVHAHARNWKQDKAMIQRENINLQTVGIGISEPGPDTVCVAGNIADKASFIELCRKN
jgi:hypothetical protein